MKISTLITLPLILIVMLISDLSSLKADESVIKVKTLTFDSIVTRRGIWKFPDANQDFRKIIMNYTLKCDPRTPHDRFDCGEWDYSSYIKVHIKTGRDTVYQLKHQEYSVGSYSDDELTILTDDEFNSIKNQKLIYYTVSKLQNSLKSESNNEIKALYDSPNENLTIKKDTPFKVQYYFDNPKLKLLGLNGENLGKLRIKFSNKNVTIKNLKITIANHKFIDTTLFSGTNTILFQNDYTIGEEEWSEILFSKQHRTLSNGLGIVLTISADKFISNETGEPIEQQMLAINDKQIFSNELIHYPTFDGKNDYIQSEKTGLLSNQSQFTIEGFVKINKWSNWSKIMGIGDKIHFETGDVKGDLYFMLRNEMNSNIKISSALTEGKWYHIAAVYNGNKESNSEKLKIYINGKSISGVYSGTLPTQTPKLNKPFNLSSNEWNTACINGAVYNVRVWNKNLTEEEIFDNIDKVLPANTDGLILNYPNSNENNINTTADVSGNNNNGINFGFPRIQTLSGDELSKFKPINTNVPAIEIVIGDFEIESKSVEEKIYTTPKIYSLSKYKVENDKLILESNTPTIKSGYQYSTDINGNIIDSVMIAGTKNITNQTLVYNSEPEPIYQNIEIGRFITPYGIGLDLGPDGFTWKYDVTDYAPILTGDVEFSAGNLQELVDVTFDFYKGTAPRKVEKFTELWGGYGNHLYKNLDNNTVLNQISVPKTPNTFSAKVRTRLTGHGHQSNTGSFPHCCEWKANTHYLSMNDDVKVWSIWQQYDCATNPVYPQGGTWPGSREGWCPGDVVKDIDFELSNYNNVESSNTFDYEITPVPSQNEGMGNGNYEMAFHFFEYGEQAHSVDAEVYEIFSPNNKGLFSRKNPICNNPVIVIRNNGKTNLTSLKFIYKVSGGVEETYNWTGDLKPNILDTISLPIISSSFWLGDDNHIFDVKISSPNNQNDEYAVNDTMSANFNMPDIIENNSTLEFLTPNYSYEQMKLTIKDIMGNILYSKDNFESQKSYKIPLDFPDGCYTMELTNEAMVGIKYWAVNGMIAGNLKIVSKENKLLKSFNPDFGYSIVYSFNLGQASLVQSPDFEYLINIFPNPSENEINCKIDNEIGIVSIEIFDAAGKVILTENNFNSNSIYKVNLKLFSAGNYFIRFKNNKFNIIKNFIKK